MIRSDSYWSYWPIRLTCHVANVGFRIARCSRRAHWIFDFKLSRFRVHVY